MQNKLICQSPNCKTSKFCLNLTKILFFFLSLKKIRTIGSQLEYTDLYNFYGESAISSHHTSKNKICHKVQIWRREGARVKVSIAETLQQMCSPQEVRQDRKKAHPACWNMSEPPKTEQEHLSPKAWLGPKAAGKVWKRSVELNCIAPLQTICNSQAKGQQLLHITSICRHTRLCKGASRTSHPVTSPHAQVQRGDMKPPGATPSNNGLGESNSPEVRPPEARNTLPLIIRDWTQPPSHARTHPPSPYVCHVPSCGGPSVSAVRSASFTHKQGPQSNGPQRTQRHSTRHMLLKFWAGGRRVFRPSPLWECVF